MKRISYLFSLLFLMTFVLFTSCKKEEEPTPPTDLQLAIEQLTGTWNVTAIDRDGTAVEFTTTPTLTFGATSYSATGADVYPGDSPVFPSTGTWAFASEEKPFNQIIISPANVNFNNVNLSNTALSFTYTTQDEKSQGEDIVVTVHATKQ